MNTGRLVGGIILFILGLIFTGTIILAIIGVPMVIIGLILIVVGAVTSPPRPVIVQQMPPQVYYVQAPPTPPPGQAPVTVNVQAAQAAPAPPQIMRRCQYCGNVFPESQLKCPKCGASF